MLEGLIFFALVGVAIGALWYLNKNHNDWFHDDK